MATISTHVLDTALGRPAADIRVVRLGPDDLPPGGYRLRFDTAAYFAATGQAGFFPEVTVAFWVEAGQRYHVPLLLSPFAYSIYRGS